MARKRDPNRNKALEIFLERNGKVKNREIATFLNVPEKTISAWKSRDKWNEVLQKDNCSTAIEKCSTTNKGGAPPGNKNAKGNKGNEQAAPPKRNSNAIKHGLFAKYLPSDTVEIMSELEQAEPADMLWDNIIIQYTAIIRSQKIMYVSDQEDLSKEESSWSSGEGGSSTTLAIQYAWDKQANFLSAQSRAMGTLSNLIKQFVSLADDQDERRLKLEMMQGQIKSLNNKLAETNPEEIENDGFLEALESEGEELWPEE